MTQNTKYKGQNQIQSKQIIIFAIVILFVILSIFLIALNFITTKEEEKQQAVLSGEFASIKEILEHYECKFIKMKDSTEDDFEVDIYVNFKYDLYDDEKSNEKFYSNVIEEVAKFLNYTNFRMIDESKEEEIEIRVIGNGNEIQTIYINGIEDYFIYMDSQISLSQYKELKTTEISIQAPELINCIQNNWNANCDFGTRETIFQNYYIYFDEGIEVRKIDGKIYNIVFTEKYVNQVINGFTVRENHDIIISRLGTPTFQNEDKSVIGYKSKDIYVFFEENQISIYRNTAEEGFDQFFALVDEFLEEKYSFLEFMNELTYLWPDYEEYTYDQETVFLSYPNKGIDVKLNYDNMDGIILYNNIGVSQDVANQYLKHTEFVAQLQVDNVYLAETRRFEHKQDLLTKCEEYKEEFEKEDNRNRGQIYNYYMKKSENDKIISAYFIAQDSQFPNCELNENIDTYIWLNDDCFVYSILNKGIYFYNLVTQEKGTILSGDNRHDYKIEAYHDQILTYDGESIQVQF